MQLVCETATMTVPTRVDPDSDAEMLRTALGKKPNEKAVIEILAHRTAPMKLAIRKAYADKYNEDLLTTVNNGKLGGDFEELCMTSIIGPIGSLARELRKKLDKEHVDEIICSANNWELHEIQAAFEALAETEEFRKDTKTTTLEALIHSKVKDHPHRDYLIRLLRGSREELRPEEIRQQLEQEGNTDRLIDLRQVNADVQELHQAGEPRTGKPDDDPFIEIISRRSNLHLRKLYDVFHQNHGITIVDFISKKLKGDVRNALNTSIMCAVDQKLLLIAQLHSSMSGLGTKEVALNRVLCLRAEHDLGLLRVLYEERIGKNLDDMVYSETSGDYRAFLMELLNSPHHGKK